MAEFIVTAEIALAASKGLALVDAGRAGDGLVPRTITDARRMADRQPLSERKVRAMPGWFARHATDRKAGWDTPGEETPGYVAWLLWGGDSAAAWAQRQVDQLDSQKRDMGDVTEDVLQPRQEALIEEFLSVTEEYGPFDTSTGANGAHYAPADANPFVKEGLICGNCEFYQPINDTEGRCAIVEGPLDQGHIEPNAICKLWVIPEDRLATRRSDVSVEQRIINETDIRDNPSVVAELRDGGDFIERRVAPVTTEIRSNADGSWTLVGHAAVFDSMSESLGGFHEVIQRGAFRKVLRNPDLAVKALFNHDQNLVLGSSTNGTLQLSEDPTGLRYEVNVADTSYGRDLRVLLERGDVTQSSFAFKVGKDGQQWSDQEDGTLLRTITEFSDLLDVSPVTYPAYRATSAAAVSATQVSSTRDAEQEGQGSAEQQAPRAASQPRRADEEGAHRHRVRRLKLREKRAA